MLPPATLAQTSFRQHFTQGQSTMIFWNELHSLCGLKIGSFITPTTEWGAANVVALVFLRFIPVKASVEQIKGNRSFVIFRRSAKPIQSSSHSIGPLAAPRDWPDLNMVWLRLLWLLNFNYRTLSRNIYFFILPSQGSKRGRKRKYNYADYYDARKATVQELTNKRALERSRKRNGVQDICSSSFLGAWRREPDA